MIFTRRVLVRSKVAVPGKACDTEQPLRDHLIPFASLGGKNRLYFGISIHRSDLFGALHEAVLAEGIEVRTGYTITGSEARNGKRVLVFERGRQSEPFDLVVDALGTRSALAPAVGRELAYGALWASLDWSEACGLDAHTLSQRYQRSSVMAGVLPLGTGEGAIPRAAFFWSLKCDDLAAWQEAGLDRWKQAVLAL